MNVGIVFLIFFALLALGIPISIAMGFTCLSVVWFTPNIMADMPFVFRNMVASLDTYSLIAVPLFILSGNIMARGGISKKLFSFFAYFIGKLPGGMPAAAVVTCLFYGAISGSAPATVAAVGAMTIPLLMELGYDKVYVTGLVTVAGSLGVIIPPSIPFIMFGLSSGESVGALFKAGVLPGILIGVFLIAFSTFHCIRNGEDREKLEANYNELHAKGFWNLVKDSIWALLTPVIILGGIYGGVVTPTEAACFSVVYAFIVSFFVYRTFTWKDIPSVLRDTVKTDASIMLVVAAASLFGRLLTLLGAPQQIAGFITSLSTDKIVVLLIINVFLLIVGMLMETTAAILILTPILVPIVKVLGVNPIHFGVIMIVNLAIGFVTPPVGVDLYVASGMTGIPVMKIAKAAMPYMIAFILALLVITFVPGLSLALT